MITATKKNDNEAAVSGKMDTRRHNEGCRASWRVYTYKTPKEDYDHGKVRWPAHQFYFFSHVAKR